MKKNPFIPFCWLPASWGLAGTTRQIAQAEYELSGYDLERRLLEIRHTDDDKTLEVAVANLDLKHKKITEHEYDLIMAKFSKVENDQKIAVLDADLKHKKITQVEYDRKRADILEEPWVSMPKIHWDPLQNHKTYFELDYNQYFLDFLIKNGYEGNEDDIINLWLNDICISIAEEISGLDGDMVTPSRRADLEDL